MKITPRIFTMPRYVIVMRAIILSGALVLCSMPVQSLNTCWKTVCPIKQARLAYLWNVPVVVLSLRHVTLFIMMAIFFGLILSFFLYLKARAKHGLSSIKIPIMPLAVIPRVVIVNLKPVVIIKTTLLPLCLFPLVNTPASMNYQSVKSLIIPKNPFTVKLLILLRFTLALNYMHFMQPIYLKRLMAV